MISVNDYLKTTIRDYPFLEEGLSKDIINYSAFARSIKPKIEKKLYKKVTEGSIVMALKRLSAELKRKIQKQKETIKLMDITVRSNITEFTFANSGSLFAKQRMLFSFLAEKKDSFCAVSQGIRETTFIASADTTLFMKNNFKGEDLIIRIDNLSSIVIRLPLETVEIPGVYYQILKILAWEKINVVEVISTYTELTIVLSSSDVERAFSALKTFDLRG